MEITGEVHDLLEGSRGASILSQVLLELFESQLADPGLAVSYDVLHDAVQAAAEFVRADGGQGGRKALHQFNPHLLLT